MVRKYYCYFVVQTPSILNLRLRLRPREPTSLELLGPRFVGARPSCHVRTLKCGPVPESSSLLPLAPTLRRGPWQASPLSSSWRGAIATSALPSGTTSLASGWVCFKVERESNFIPGWTAHSQSKSNSRGELSVVVQDRQPRRKMEKGFNTDSCLESSL